jgi:predicted PurR-regulated permease PerM
MLGIDPRAARVAWTVFLVAAALFIVYSVRTTLLLIVFAVFFAYLLFPLVQLVDRHTPRRVPRIAALALVFVSALAVVILAAALLGNRIVDEASRLAQQLPTMLDTTNLSQRIPIPAFLEPQRERLISFIGDQLRSGTGQALPFAQQVGEGLMHAAGNLIYVVLVPILSFLFIKEAPDIKLHIRSWLGRSKSEFWLSIAEDLNVLLASYVRALVLLSIATFISYGIVFSAIGVPYSAMLAGIAALMEVIPVAGPVAAVATILIVCMFSGYGHILWVVVFIAVYRLFQDYALGPYLMGQGVELSSLIVILGLLAGEELGGVAGIFLAVPVLAAGKIILARMRARRSSSDQTARDAVQ